MSKHLKSIPNPLEVMEHVNQAETGRPKAFLIDAGDKMPKIIVNTMKTKAVEGKVPATSKAKFRKPYDITVNDPEANMRMKYVKPNMIETDEARR